MEVQRRKKKKRKSNFAACEVSAIMEGIGKRMTTVNAKFTDSVTNAKKMKAWQEIAELVNTVSPVGRSVEEVKKKWEDMKTRTKKRAMEVRSVGLLGDDDSAQIRSYLTEYELRVLYLLGDAAVGGTPPTSSGNQQSGVQGSGGGTGGADNEEEEDMVQTAPKDMTIDHQQQQNPQEEEPRNHIEVTEKEKSPSPTPAVESKFQPSSSTIVIPCSSPSSAHAPSHQPTHPQPPPPQPPPPPVHPAPPPAHTAPIVSPSRASIQATISAGVGLPPQTIEHVRWASSEMPAGVWRFRANNGEQADNPISDDQCSNFILIEKERLAVEKQRLQVEKGRLDIEEKRLQMERRRFKIEKRRFQIEEALYLSGGT